MPSILISIYHGHYLWWFLLIVILQIQSHPDQSSENEQNVPWPVNMTVPLSVMIDLQRSAQVKPH